VVGFDLVGENLERAAGRGVNPERSAADAAKDAEIVVTMLPAGKQVLEVLSRRRAGGGESKHAVHRFHPRSMWCPPARAHRLATEAGMLALDAPVSGGVGGAEAASLTFMAGGTAAAFAQAKPILGSMGRRVIHCGDAGAGQAAKICNNMMLGINMIGVSEAFTLAEKLGLSPKALFDVAAASSGQSWALTSYCPVPGLVAAAPANNNYKPGFASALMLKDLKLAQEAAAAAGASTPLGAAAAQLFGLHNAWGEGGTDFSGIIHLIRGRGGQ
jgi:3-hydroxyisobutyrate dehydrogenase